MTATAKKYNKGMILKQAWVIFRNNSQNLTFSESLKQSWSNAKKSIETSLKTVKKVEIKGLDFNTIYKENYGMVKGWVKFKIANIDAIEEVANNVFLKVYKHLEVFDCERGKLKTWLYQITKNAIIDYYRVNKNSSLFVNVDSLINDEEEKIDSSNVFIANVDSNSSIENEELKAKMMLAFRNLKTNYRKVAIMYFMNGLKYNEIADAMQISMANVKVSIMRAKEMLQNELQAEYSLL
jgi:RNA polymerase sigma-70 factor (ECF subfamily)